MITDAILDAMVESGCSAEQIAAVVKAALRKQDDKKTEQRARDAERQRRHRKSRNVTQCHSDNANVTHGNVTLPPLVPPSSPCIPTIPPIIPPSASEKHAQAEVSRETIGEDWRGAFEDWYQRYPHKVGRKAAEKAYAAAHRKVDAATLLEGIQRYIASKPADRPWCNPATWLNQERWLDQPNEAKQTGGNHATRQQQPTRQERIDAAGDAALAEIFADIEARYGEGEGGAPEGPDQTELQRVPRLRGPAGSDYRQGSGVPSRSGHSDIAGDFQRLPALDAGTVDDADTSRHSGIGTRGTGV